MPEAYSCFTHMFWFDLWSLLVSLCTFIATVGTSFRFIFVLALDLCGCWIAIKDTFFGYDWTMAFFTDSLCVRASKPNVNSLKLRPFVGTFSGLNLLKILNVLFDGKFAVIVRSW